MPITNGAAGKVTRHFETVPLEVVKEIAVEDLPTDEMVGEAIEKVEPADKKLLIRFPARSPDGTRRSS